MEAAKTKTSEIQWRNSTLSLQISQLKNTNTELTITALWNKIKFQKSIRSQDLKISHNGKRQSLFFLKLLLEQHITKPSCIHPMRKSQIMLKNVITDKNDIQRVGAAIRQNVEMQAEQVQGLGIKLSFGDFELLLQVPKVIARRYEQPIVFDMPQQYSDYKQLSDSYLLASLQEWFINQSD